MILTHGSNSIGRFVEIGGRKYPVVKIGNQLWLAENLDYKFDGCIISSVGNPQDGNTATPTAWYYNNDESTYGIDGVKKCGLMYNWYAVNQIQNHIPNGWRVATISDWNALISSSGNSGNALKSINNSLAAGTWPTNWNGLDSFGFSILPGGSFVPSKYDQGGGNFQFVDDYTHYWMSDSYSSTEAYRNYFQRSDIIGSVVTKEKLYGFYVRLVKDAT